MSRLRRCGLRDDDLFAQLRQHGVFDVAGLRYVLYESKGALSPVPAADADAPLVAAALDGATGFP